MDNFYLAGGTGLAIQIGHRVDELVKTLSDNFEIKIMGQDIDSLDCLIDGVKVSFLSYPYKILNEFVEYKGVNMASIEDILAMKISAIMSRGSKKDFVDVYST